MRKLSEWSVVLALVFVLVPAVSATTWINFQELPELVVSSQRAALAEVTNVRYGIDERGLHSTWIRFDVQDRLFGPIPEQGEFEIKIYGAPVPLGDSGMVDFVDGTPRYAVGQTILIMLIGDSVWGFTSAAGLNQGAFMVSQEDGRRMATSAAGNRVTLGPRGLGRFVDGSRVSAEDRSQLGETSEPVSYDLLKEAILNIRAARGGVE